MRSYSSPARGHHSSPRSHCSFVMRLFNFHCKLVCLVKLLNFLISFPFSEAANLCLSAYTQAFVVAELDKLTPQKKFTEVLKLGFLPPKEKKDEPMVTEGGEMKVTERPKGDEPVAGTSTAASEGDPVPPPATPMQKTHSWVKSKKLPPMYEAQELYKGGSSHYSLQNAAQLIRICEYLHMNGKLEICKTPLDGACLYHAMRWGADFPQEYVFQLLKRQIVVWMAQNADYCLKFYGDTIKGIYGGKRLPQEEYDQKKKEGTLTAKQIQDQNEPGPFSFLASLKYHLNDNTWGDEIIVDVCGKMWQIAITIVYAETLVEQRFRHDRDLGDADLVLIFCGGNHYCGAGNQF